MKERSDIFLGKAAHPSLGEDAVCGDLAVGQFGLRFDYGTGALDFPYQGLEIDISEDEEEVQFRHPKNRDWVLVTSDFSILQHRSIAQRTHLKNRIAQVRVAREGLPAQVKLTLAALAAMALLIIIAWTQNDRIMRGIVGRISLTWEQELGDGVVKDLKPELELVNDTNLVAQLNGLVAKLIERQPKNGRTFKVYVVNDNDPNAVAFPGGHIFVNVGLIRIASRTEEVAAVLAHEIAHVMQRHGLRSMADRIGPGLILKTVMNDDGGVLMAIAGTAHLLNVLKYSRHYEDEADELAWGYLVKANIDPRGLSEFFKKLKDDPKLSDVDFLSTHPPTKERIQKLDDKWKKLSRKSGFDRLPPLRTMAVN